MSQPSKISTARKIMHKLRWYQKSIFLHLIVLLISRLPDIGQRCFSISDRPMVPTLQMKDVPAFQHVYVYNKKHEAKTKVGRFSRHPIYQLAKNLLVIFYQLINSCQSSYIEIDTGGIKSIENLFLCRLLFHILCHWNHVRQINHINTRPRK